MADMTKKVHSYWLLYEAASIHSLKIFLFDHVSFGLVWVTLDERTVSDAHMLKSV